MKTYFFLGSIDKDWMNLIETVETFPFKVSVGDEIAGEKFTASSVKRAVIILGQPTIQLVVI